MRTQITIIAATLVSASLSVLTMNGCDQKPSAPANTPSANEGAKNQSHDHAPGDGHDHKAGDGHDHKAGDGHDHKAGDGHDHKAGDGHDHKDDHAHGQGDGHGHGPTTELGQQSAGGFTIRASRDGEIKAGGDAPIDIWVTGGADKVRTVRIWIGTEDAKGSMKAKAELEKDNWHTHAEVPSPLPAGSRLWVEIETEKSAKVVAGFELKQ